MVSEAVSERAGLNIQWRRYCLAFLGFHQQSGKVGVGFDMGCQPV